MKPSSILWGGVLVLAACSTTPSASLPAHQCSRDIDQERALLAALVEKLGSDEIADREVAQAALTQLGPRVRPYMVRLGQETTDVEVRSRAYQVADYWSIEPVERFCVREYLLVGKALAQEGLPSSARIAFDTVLSFAPEHVEARHFHAALRDMLSAQGTQLIEFDPLNAMEPRLRILRQLQEILCAFHSARTMKALTFVLRLLGEEKPLLHSMHLLDDVSRWKAILDFEVGSGR